jgi:hypothetical protein
VEIRRITAFQDSQDKSFYDPHLNWCMDIVVGACYPSYSVKHKLEDHSPGQPGHKAKPYLNNNQHKRANEVAQEVEHQPSKHKKPPPQKKISVGDEVDEGISSDSIKLSK